MKLIYWLGIGGFFSLIFLVEIVFASIYTVLNFLQKVPDGQSPLDLFKGFQIARSGVVFKVESA